MMLPPTWSWIEVAWVLMGLCTAIFAAQNVRQAVINYRIQQTRVAPLWALIRTAWIAVRRAVVILGLQCVFLVIGIRALFYGPAPGATWDASLVGLLMIGAQLSLLWLSVRTAQDEAALRRDYLARLRKGRR